MTELDFLPQWYKANRRRRQSYVRRYMVIGLLFALCVLWCFAAGRGVSRARAELNSMRSNFETGIQKVQRFKQLQSELTDLQQKAAILDSNRPRTPYSAIIAELSHCVGSNITLQKLNILAEAVENGEKTSPKNPAMVRLGASAGSQSVSDTVSQTQTRVIMQGIAASGQQVAELISAMEKSEYFRSVFPNYSRNQKIGENQITEFEIRCIVADFEIVQ